MRSTTSIPRDDCVQDCVTNLLVSIVIWVNVLVFRGLYSLEKSTVILVLDTTIAVRLLNWTRRERKSEHSQSLITSESFAQLSRAWTPNVQHKFPVLVDWLSKRALLRSSLRADDRKLIYQLTLFNCIHSLSRLFPRLREEL